MRQAAWVRILRPVALFGVYAASLVIGTLLLQAYDAGRYRGGQALEEFLIKRAGGGPLPGGGMMYPAGAWTDYYRRLDFPGVDELAELLLKGPTGFLLFPVLVLIGVIFATTSVGRGLPLVLPMLLFPWLAMTVALLNLSDRYYRTSPWEPLAVLVLWTGVVVAGWWIWLRPLYREPVAPAGSPEAGPRG